MTISSCAQRTELRGAKNAVTALYLCRDKTYVWRMHNRNLIINLHLLTAIGLTCGACVIRIIGSKKRVWRYLLMGMAVTCGACITRIIGFKRVLAISPYCILIYVWRTHI